MDLVLEDESRVGMVIFMASAENLHREIGLPWMSFGSDAGSIAPEGVFLRSRPPPPPAARLLRRRGLVRPAQDRGPRDVHRPAPRRDRRRARPGQRNTLP